MGQNSFRMRGYTVNGDANIEMTLPFVKQHCLRTRRLLDMTVGHNNAATVPIFMIKSRKNNHNM